MYDFQGGKILSRYLPFLLQNPGSFFLPISLGLTQVPGRIFHMPFPPPACLAHLCFSTWPWSRSCFEFYFVLFLFVPSLMLSLCGSSI